MSGYISLSISSSNKLIINTLGKINNRKISFQIKGLTTGKIVDVTSSEIEKIIEIDSRDKEIQFIVNVNKKEFSKIVKLQ